MTDREQQTTEQAPDSTIDVDLQAAARVALVTFSRGRHNYVSYDFLDSLATTIDELQATGCRAVVLRTTNGYFSAGADFVGQGPSGVTGPHIYDMVPRLFRLPLPVVAAIGGPAIGAGLGLATAADFRIATPSAYFLANFTRLGISQGFGLSLTLPRLIGPQRTAEMLYTARRIGGEEAVEIGLCDRLVPPERLLDEALALASEIAMSSPRAILSARRTLRSDLISGIEDMLRHERSEQQPLIASEDFREGVNAWRERRPPNFGGE